MLTRCNKCGRIFRESRDLALLIEYDKNGKTVCEKYDCLKTYPELSGVFEGCPNCMTDGYLMDIEED